MMPGTSSNACLSVFLSIPRSVAARPGVSPETAFQVILGLCPKLSMTELTRETRPLAISRLNLTLPSVTETFTS